MVINVENIKVRLIDLNPKLAKQWHPTKNGELTPYEFSFGSGKKVWWKCDNGHHWNATIASRNNGNGCPYCANQKVWIGFNDLWTTNPELASLLANPEDGYKFVEGSGYKVDWKCPNCKLTIQDKTIVTTRNNGLKCPCCSDGFKFPEKIMNTLLSNLEVNYNHNIKLKWSNNKRYDFYIQSLDMIIETHGGQHYESSTGNWNRPLKEEQDNDRYKYELALANGIKPENYIVIDCRKSDLEFIKNNILNSRLNEIFDLSKVNWGNIYKNSQKSLKLEVLRMFLQETTSVPSIARKLNLHTSTVSKYLKDLSSNGLCNHLDSKHFIYQVDLDGNIVNKWSGRDVLMKNFTEKVSRKSLEFAYKNLTPYLNYYWISTSPREIKNLVNNTLRGGQNE